MGSPSLQSTALLQGKSERRRLSRSPDAFHLALFAILLISFHQHELVLCREFTCLERVQVYAARHAATVVVRPIPNYGMLAACHLSLAQRAHKLSATVL